MQLAAGEVGVRATGDRVLDELAVGSTTHGTQRRHVIHATVAAVLRRAALFGLPWRCLWGVEDTSGYPAGDRRELFQPYLTQLADVALRDDVLVGAAEKYWFLLGSGGRPLAAFDIDGYVHRPDDGGSRELTDAPGESSASIADELFAPLVSREVGAADASAVGPYATLGVPALLSAFNRKERLFLFGYAAGVLDEVELHAPSLPLDSGFRAALGRALDLDVPAHAWSGVDYHLSWLHAALQWHRGRAWPGQGADLPATGEASADVGDRWVTGTQEDGDLVLAWTEAGVPRVVLVEAKAYGAWGNAQLGRKLHRVAAIRKAAGASVDLRFVLTSPRPPARLDTSGWPAGWEAWAGSPGGSPSWLPLPAPRLRLATERCYPTGHASSTGEHWRIAGPLA